MISIDYVIIIHGDYPDFFKRRLFLGYQFRSIHPVYKKRIKNATAVYIEQIAADSLDDNEKCRINQMVELFNKNSSLSRNVF